MKYYSFIFLFLIISGCNPQENLRKEILTALEEQHGSIQISKLTAFIWDRLYILGPYTSARNFDATLSTQKKLIELTGISSRDDMLLLMFFNNKTLVESTVIKRYNLDSEMSTQLISKWYKPQQILFYTRNATSRGFVIKEIK